MLEHLALLSPLSHLPKWDETVQPPLRLSLPVVPESTVDTVLLGGDFDSRCAVAWKISVTRGYRYPMPVQKLW